jgi:tRNA U38,U39,U40 pseudouridine synthase TruA
MQCSIEKRNCLCQKMERNMVRQMVTLFTGLTSSHSPSEQLDEVVTDASAARLFKSNHESERLCLIQVASRGYTQYL